MCGIGGAWFGKSVDREFLTRLIFDSERRGIDAFGATIVKRSGERVSFKRVGPAHASLRETAWSEFLERLCPGDLLLFNTRAQPLTEPESKGVDTVQPVESERFVVVHNGVVSNDFELTERWALQRKSPIDSEVIALMCELHGVAHAFSYMSGGFAVAMSDFAQDELLLHLVKDFKTLATGYRRKDQAFAFASELGTLKYAFEDEGGLFEPTTYELVPPYTAWHIVFGPEGPELLSEHGIETQSICSLPNKSWSKAVVCASGGIDSTTAAYVAKRVHGCSEVTLVHFDHGQKSEIREWEAVCGIARRLGARAEKVRFPWLGALGRSVLTDSELSVPVAEPKNIKSTVCWTPARNLAMMSALASIAEAIGAAHIYAGWSLEEEGSYPDNSIDFFRTFNDCLDYGTIMRPKIKLPLARLMKKETVLLGNYLEVPYDLTWSCDDGSPNGHCGRCGACFLHHYSFLLAGLPDPTRYANPLAFPFKPPWEQPEFRATPVPMTSILRKL